MVHTHLNIKNLDYYKIGLISEYIIQRISLNKIKRYNLEDILTILRKALDQNRLSLNSLKEKVKNELTNS